MIKFFRDTLNGPLYFIVAILAIILIMAIIGFILERKQKQAEQDNQVAHIDNKGATEQPAPVENAQ